MSETDTPISHRTLAVDLFNHVWSLLERLDRTPVQDAEMIHAAHASRYHWSSIGGPKQFSIGEWQISRVYATLGRAEPAIYHAKLSLVWAQKGDLAPFYIGYAHEAIARAQALTNDPKATDSMAAANAGLEKIEKSEDADALRQDLKSIRPRG